MTTYADNPFADIPLPAGKIADRILKSDMSGKNVAVAYSGGADSTGALLWAIARFGASRVNALHYHHGVRGAAADRDLKHARDTAERLGVAFHSETRMSGPADEASLRRDRLDFLVREVRSCEAVLLIQGHQADDIAETQLMRIARGSGTAGLAAPRPLSRLPDDTPIVRPLLGLRKCDILARLARTGIPWVHDETNDDGEFATRNRIRAAVIPPWLAANPGNPARGAMRSRMLAEEDDEALSLWAEKSLSATFDKKSARWAPPADFPRAILRRALRLFLSDAAPRHAIESDAFDRLLDQYECGESGRMSLGANRYLMFAPGLFRIEITSPEKPSVIDALVPVPGAVFFPDGSRLDVSITAPGESDDTRRVFLLPPAHPLACGPCRDGERYVPIGNNGSKKLREAMSDRKIPQEMRLQIPVVRIGNEVLWCPGLPPAHSARLSGSEKKALRLTWTPSEAACPFLVLHEPRA